MEGNTRGDKPDVTVSPKIAHRALGYGLLLKEIIRTPEAKWKLDDTIDAYPWGMYVRILSLYSSALLLTVNNFAAESYIIGRSLFDESLRLSILANMDVDTRRRTLATWLGVSLKKDTRIFTLIRDDPKIEWDTADVFDAIDDATQNIDNYRTSQETGTESGSDPFDYEALLREAQRLGRNRGWTVREAAHKFTHGNRYALHVLVDDTEDGGIMFRPQLDRPMYIASATYFAAESVVMSHYAAAQLFDTPIHPQVPTTYAELSKLMDTEAERLRILTTSDSNHPPTTPAT